MGFSCFASRCAEPTNFTFQHQSILPCRISPTRKARGSNPPGCTKSSTLWGATLFALHGFYRAAKGRIRTARAPRFASRGAETPRWGVSRARLGESSRSHQKSPCNVLCKAIFCLLYFCFNLASATYHQWHPCTAPAQFSCFAADSCKTDFLTGENCFFTHRERIYFEYQISSFTPTCVHGSLPIIVIAQRFQQNNFIGARQLDFSHNPIAFPNFSCALRLFLSKA